jgi:hypothetical protein
MEMLFIIIAAVVFALIGFVAYRFLKVRAQRKKLESLRFNRIQPLFDQLNSETEISTDDILPFAQNILTRHDAYHLLKKYDKAALFPAEYFTLLKGAESALAVWLEFPTELDACPDEIEHIKRVTIDFDGNSNFVHYEVFKYRVDVPHWAAKNGWMLGVVGPFFDDSEPYHFAQATFSRTNSSADKVTPEDEAKWVHQNISMRR